MSGHTNNVVVCNDCTNPVGVEICSTPEIPEGQSVAGTALYPVPFSDLASITVTVQTGSVEISFDGGTSWPISPILPGSRTWGQGNNTRLNTANMVVRGLSAGTQYDVIWDR